VRGLAATAALALLFAPSLAQAAGYYVTGVGVRGMGRAAANVVGADDMSAQYYNPAALTRVDNMAQLQLAGVHQAVYFARADDLISGGGTLSFDPVKNAAPPMPIPSLGLATGFGDPDLTVALGVYTPYAPLLDFPGDGAQRFSLVESTVLSGNVGPTVAYRFADRLSVGVGVAYTFLQVDQTLVAHMVPESGFEATDDPDYDIVTAISAQDPFAITWNAGLLYEPPDGRWAAALAFVPPVTFDATGSLSSDLSKNAYFTGESPMGKLILVESATDDDVSLSVTMPMMLKAGGLLRIGDDKELELDVVWQRWSDLGQLRVTDMDLEIELDLDENAFVEGDIALPTVFQDAWSVRLGGEHRVRDRLTGRLGVMVETSAVDPTYQAVMMPDGLKFGYGLGATFDLVPEALALDLGFFQSIVPKHEIDRTLVRQVAIDPLTGFVHEGKDVGKGTFGVTNTVFGLGLAWSPGAGS
jgi:long-chain fatty acid transport protein